MTHWLLSIRDTWANLQRQRRAAFKLETGKPLTDNDLSLLPRGLRYFHACRHSEPALDRLRATRYGPVIGPFLDRLAELAIDVRRATGLPAATSRAAFMRLMGHQPSPPRDGATIVEVGYLPVIVYIEQMHDTDEALMDTLFHEAIHAVGRLVGRFEAQPENMLTRPYWLEEVTAIYGAQLLGKHFGIRDPETDRSMKRVIAELMVCIGERAPVMQALDYSEVAVAYLLASGPHGT